MPWLRIKLNNTIWPTLTIKLVAMATSLDHWKKGVRWVIYDQIPHGENLLKIGPVDPETILLNIYFLKKKLTHAECI